MLVKWLASPINPLDLIKIQGLYPIKTDFPVIGGSEGAGVVEKVKYRSGVSRIQAWEDRPTNPFTLPYVF